MGCWVLLDVSMPQEIIELVWRLKPEEGDIDTRIGPKSGFMCCSMVLLGCRRQVKLHLDMGSSSLAQPALIVLAQSTTSRASA